MKAAEIRELSSDELNGRVKDLDDQLFRARVQKSMGQLEAPLMLRSLRRDRARVKTVLRERQGSGDERQSTGDRHGRERQDGEDGRRGRRASGPPRRLRQDSAPHDDVRRARRDQRGQEGRHGRHRRVPAAQPSQAVDGDARGPEGPRRYRRSDRSGAWPRAAPAPDGDTPGFKCVRFWTSRTTREPARFR